MPKRKASADSAADAPLRRSTRQHTSTSAPPAAARSATPKAAKVKKDSIVGARISKSKGKAARNADVKDEEEDVPALAAAATKKAPGGKAAKAKTETDTDATGGTTERQYWLMRAEPETRYENGVDVSFSIDDLAGKTAPEPWDGIRNYSARNNMRAMKKGDLAFFSHSNCKEPGIVGIMEIVREHEPDLSALDPKAAYYDPKATAADPKWSIVHVEFRRKFAVPLPIKELRAHARPGGPLADMQMVKQSRLSVSRVSAEEWAFLMGLAEAKEKEVAK